MKKTISLIAIIALMAGFWFLLYTAANQFIYC
jgi:hypothetical protein